MTGMETCLETFHCSTSLFSALAFNEEISKAAQEVKEEEEMLNVRAVFQEQIIFRLQRYCKCFPKQQ